MKKLSIIVLLIASLPTIGNAQESTNETDNREKFQLTFKGGLNYSNVYDEKGDQFNADAKLGGIIGVGIKIPMGKYLGIHPEAQISQKGFKATGVILGGPYSFTRTTTYLDFPILFAVKPSEFITLVGGPHYSYLINQRDVFANATSSIAQEQEFENDNIRKNIFGFSGGFDINLRHIVLGARLAWDIQNNNGNGTATTPRYKNVWFQGTIGYSFYK